MNVTVSPYTLRELKRQAGFHRTMYRQHEEKHQAAQAKKLETIKKLEAEIAKVEALDNLEKEEN
jgi:hypothetical protein